MNNITLAVLYLAGINLTAFVAFGLDKRYAKVVALRIPERTLMMLVALGGSVGAWLGMRVFHHKTRKQLFAVGVPVILMMQIAVVWLVRRMLG